MAWAAALPWIGKGVMSGIGALTGWLGGRAQSKQHQRQLASEERREQMMYGAFLRWMEHDAAQREAFQRRKAESLQALAPSMGISPEMASAIALGGGGGGGAPAPNFRGMVSPSRGVPSEAGGGVGRFNYMDYLAGVFGPEPGQARGGDPGPFTVTGRPREQQQVTQSGERLSDEGFARPNWWA